MLNRRLSLSQARKDDADKFASQSHALKKEEELKKLESTFKTDQSHALESQFKSDTVGLLSASEFKQKKAQVDAMRIAAEKRKAKELKNAARKKQRINVLSFEPEPDEEVVPAALVRITKNPSVDTSYLRDSEREACENALRAQFEMEWLTEQEKVKQENLEIVYSYWDGSGNRKTCTVKKGFRIDQFLEVARKQLAKEIPQLACVSADNLVYVKEDLLIPHHCTFYELLINKARGKSGPLFSFDVHDDIRLLADATVEKEESHAGKIMTRSWYERNKHVFPCSRWELYDPTKTYEKYTTAEPRRK